MGWDDSRLPILKWRLARAAVLIGTLTFSVGKSYVGWRALDWLIGQAAIIYSENRAITDEYIDEELDLVYASKGGLTQKHRKLIKEMVHDLEKKGTKRKKIEDFIFGMSLLNPEEIRQAYDIYRKGVSQENLRSVIRKLDDLEYNMRYVQLYNSIYESEKALDFIIQAKGLLEELLKFGLDVRDAKAELLALEKEYKKFIDSQKESG